MLTIRKLTNDLLIYFTLFLLQKYTGKCTCNASDILEAIKDNEILRETIRGPPGLPGKEGKTGAPGLTVSECINARTHTCTYMYTCTQRRRCADAHINKH